MDIREHVSLASFTTMRTGGNARFFVRANTVKEMEEAVLFARAQRVPFFVLGGGSNTLFSDDGFSGLVIKNEIQGIVCDGTMVTVGGGEVWDDVVRIAVERNLWGIENLSLIPGTVGGAAVQNIGAYGGEVHDTIFSVEVFDTDTMSAKIFLHDECAYGYRESIFKRKKNFIVTAVSFQLTQERNARIDYEDVKKYFEEKEITDVSLLEIREAIVAIRTQKMPAYPLGTAGSFFKNPVVTQKVYQELKKTFPEIKAYSQGDSTVKLAAAWLLDKVGGWRGVRRGDAGVHERQALILVNYGSASTQEMLSLADEMKKDIKEKINVVLEEEVVRVHASL